jgi:hypothetical protein
MRRRAFLAGLSALPLLSSATLASALYGAAKFLPEAWQKAEKKRVIAAGTGWLSEKPKTITLYRASRSPGDLHAYYSEGDYWWPDPANPSGPYIRRDGLSNPDRFDDHRQALIRLSRIVPALTAAWMASGKRSFAVSAKAHLLAWFVDPDTRMAPHLEHAQAIIGVNSGRGIGIIDTLHLCEVALAAKRLLNAKGLFSAQEAASVRVWFADYLKWMRTSPNGRDEADEANNHGSCYVLQIACFAKLGQNMEHHDWCRSRFRQLIDGQIEADGRQPLELARTKPFGYCLFNLDVLAASAHLLSDKNENLWRYKNAKGGSLELALAYMGPFIADKSRWPHRKDVEYWNDWPVRHPALLFGGIALDRPDYLQQWQGLDPDPKTAEIIRNFPIRQPLVWS